MGAPLAVAIASATLFVCLPVIVAANELTTRYEAMGAADAAALAAADALTGWLPGEPCQMAASVVAAFNKELAGCAVADLEVQVSVVYGVFRQQILARAGVVW